MKKAKRSLVRGIMPKVTEHMLVTGGKSHAPLRNYWRPKLYHSKSFRPLVIDYSHR
jgi:hypothetical protein